MRHLLNAGFVALLAIALAACSSATDNTDNTENTDNNGTTDTTDTTDNTDTTDTVENTAPEIPAGGCYKQMAYDSNGDGEKDRDALIVFNANGDWVHYEIQDINGNATFVMQYEYDEDYNLLQRTNRDATGEITYQENYTYDENGFANSYDKDADGDGFIEESWTSVNNANGKRTAWNTDNDGDGMDDASAEFSYNEEGKLATYAYDSGANGFVNTNYVLDYVTNDDGTYTVTTTGTQTYYDSLETYTYNGERVATYTEDTNNDGSIEYSQAASFNDDGSVDRILVDANGDGTDDMVFVVLNHNDNGDTVRSQKQTLDGEVISTTAYAYTSAGNIGLITVYDRNGVITSRTVNTFNDNGDLLTQTSDDDVAEGNGDDSVFTALYDEAGNRIGGEFEALGNQNDAPENVSTALTWDAEGNILTSETDYGNDGDLDQSFAMTVNTDGNILTRLTTGSGDTNPDYRSVEVYDANDQLQTETQDYYADDTTDQVEAMEWDSMGNATLYTVDLNGDGTTDERWAQEFDANGFFTSYRSDEDNNGVWDFALIAESECLTE